MAESIGPLNDNTGKAEGCRRTTGRIQQEQLISNLGPVVDISRGGLSVITDRKLRGELEVTLPTDDDELTVPARVIWSRRKGLRRFAAGLQFIDIDEATAKRLACIAMTHTRAYPLAG